MWQIWHSMVYSIILEIFYFSRLFLLITRWQALWSHRILSMKLNYGASRGSSQQWYHLWLERIVNSPLFLCLLCSQSRGSFNGIKDKNKPKVAEPEWGIGKGAIDSSTSANTDMLSVLFCLFSFFPFFRFSLFFFPFFFWMYNLPLVRPYWNVCGSATSALLRRVRTRRLDFLHQLRLGTSLEPFWNNLAVPFPPCYPVYFSLNYYYYYYFGYFPLCWYHLFLDMPIITITIGSWSPGSAPK